MNEERTGKCLRQVEHIRGHLCHRNSIKVNQVMVATVKLSKWWLQLIRGTLGSGTSLLAATLYQGHLDRNHKLSNIVSIEIYILHMQVLLECCYIWMESSRWENWNHLFCRKVSFYTASHCQFWGVGPGMKQTYLYMWYPLLQYSIATNVHIHIYSIVKKNLQVPTITINYTYLHTPEW
jgi:hypothetical protein